MEHEAFSLNTPDTVYPVYSLYICVYILYCTCLHICVCLSAYLTFYLVFLSALAVLLSSILGIWPSNYLSSHLSIYPSVIYTSIRLSILHLSHYLPCAEHVSAFCFSLHMHTHLQPFLKICAYTFASIRAKLRSASVQAVAARLEAGSKGPTASGGDWTSNAGCGGRLDARHVFCALLVSCRRSNLRSARVLPSAAQAEVVRNGDEYGFPRDAFTA